MKILKVVFFALGLGLLIWIIQKLGVESILQGFRTLGWKLIIPIALAFPGYVLYTVSWRLFLNRFDHHSIPFWSLCRIKIAGEAANTLTPLNFAGGDPVRVWLLSKSFPATISGASVVVDRTLQILAIIALIALGNGVAIFTIDLPGWTKVFLGVMVFLLALLVLFFILHQQKGLFQKIFKLGARFRFKFFSPERLKTMEELDHHIGNFYRRDKKLFFFCFLLHFAARLLGIVEIFLIARFLHVPLGIFEALFFAAIIPMTNLLSVIVPGTLGVLEGIVSSLFLSLHGEPAAGIVLQMARRIRAFFWIVIGLGIIFLFKQEKRKNSCKKVLL